MPTEKSPQTVVLTQQQKDELARDGVICLKDVLDERSIEIIKSAFDYRLENLTPKAVEFYKGSGATFITDGTDPESWYTEPFQRMFAETPVVDLASQLFSGQNVWFYYEQIFLKEGGAARRTPWHQDISYLPVEGNDIVRFWINLDPVEKENSLEFVRGSHRGVVYNGTSFSAEDDTAPLYASDEMPRLPDIESEREKWDIVSWAVNPSDIIAFHPAALHGGAGTDRQTRRRSISLVFFGDDLRYQARPEQKGSEGDLSDRIGAQEDLFAGLKDGDLFRLPHLPRLRP